MFAPIEGIPEVLELEVAVPLAEEVAEEGFRLPRSFDVKRHLPEVIEKRADPRPLLRKVERLASTAKARVSVTYRVSVRILAVQRAEARAWSPLQLQTKVQGASTRTQVQPRSPFAQATRSVPREVPLPNRRESESVRRVASTEGRVESKSDLGRPDVYEREGDGRQEQHEQEGDDPQGRAPGEQQARPFPKPVLEKPKLDIFALYYILDKIGIESEYTSYGQYKGEIEELDAQTTVAHKKMLEEMKAAFEKERESERWGIAAKVFSWIGSAMSVLAGAVLIATGVGAIAGAMMVASGVITLATQIMEITGGWKKVVELLPGNDKEKKRAVLSWIQIGIMLLCLILSLVGVAFGGITSLGEAMSTANNLFTSSAMIGGGVAAIGKGINDSLFYNRKADQTWYEIKLKELKHKREDIIGKVEESPEMLGRFYESLADNLGFQDEINAAYQAAWK